MALTRAVTPGYLEAIGIPLLRGRDFSDSEVEGTSPVVVLSEATAR